LEKRKPSILETFSFFLFLLRVPAPSAWRAERRVRRPKTCSLGQRQPRRAARARRRASLPRRLDRRPRTTVTTKKRHDIVEFVSVVVDRCRREREEWWGPFGRVSSKQEHRGGSKVHPDAAGGAAATWARSTARWGEEACFLEKELKNERETERRG
jgi:hypothetical protein